MLRWSVECCDGVWNVAMDVWGVAMECGVLRWSVECCAGVWNVVMECGVLRKADVVVEASQQLISSDVIGTKYFE